MQISLMKRPRRMFVLMALLAISVGLMFALLAGGDKLPAIANAAVHHAARATHHAAKASASDPDNVQSGDQTTPDSPQPLASESESSAEAEQGQPGEPAAGHQDAAGSVGSDCTGNCVQ
jgi:DMSO/TMAO reductase YedYZ molybdopterin-dependent catalytic subunit